MVNHIKQTRESQMELLRIISIIAIIFYHILMFAHDISDTPIYQALFLPLHVGVLLFVMISGYFHIKFSIKKLIMIIVPMFVYTLPCIISSISDNSQSITSISKQLLFVSHSQYWYMRTYIGLFLLSPLINKYLNSCSTKSRAAFIICLLIISTWWGTSSGDISLYAGKNIINFMLLYSIGDTIRKNHNYVKQISMQKLVFAYVFLNILLVSTFTYFSGLSIAKIIFHLSYPYCSPILLINSILLFLIFEKISLYSSIINYTAKSVLAVYLIHCNNVIFPTFIEPAIISIHHEGDIAMNIFRLLALSIVVFIICIIIDKILTPLWRITEKASTIINGKLNIEYS